MSTVREARLFRAAPIFAGALPLLLGGCVSGGGESAIMVVLLVGNAAAALLYWVSRREAARKDAAARDTGSCVTAVRPAPAGDLAAPAAQPSAGNPLGTEAGGTLET